MKATIVDKETAESIIKESYGSDPVRDTTTIPSIVMDQRPIGPDDFISLQNFIGTTIHRWFRQSPDGYWRGVGNYFEILKTI